MAQRRTVRTFCPEYGLVRTPVVVGVLAIVTAVAAPAVASAVGVGILDEVLYGVTAAVGLGALAYEAVQQRRDNPHEFVARDVLAQFYEQQRPGLREHLLHLGAALVGLAAVWRGAEPALGRREGALLLLDRLAAGEPLPPVDPVNVGWAVVTAVGLVLLAVGIDRLLVGGYREFRYHLARR